MIGERVGNFQIVAQLGKGGMGEVYLGEHVERGTRVAIKMLLPHVSANDDLVRRFFNEANAVGQIQHAGTAKIFDSGTHAGRAFLVMEFLPGETIAARLRRLGRFPLASAGELGKQIAGVLEAVHKAGITHRDLKPDNIFIVPDDELGERIKIVDFGIAKLSGIGGGMTATTASALGTPAYMSPEQWKNAKHVDWRADAYSLGCVMFEMLTGRPPFIAETIGEACAKHLTEEPPALSSILRVSPELDALLAQLLDKVPDRRPASMRDIANAFAALAGSPDELPVMHAVSPDALPAAGQGATQVSYAPTPPMLNATTMGRASGQLIAAKPRNWIAIGLGIALAATIAVLVLVMMKSDDPAAQVVTAENPAPPLPVPKPPVVEPPRVVEPPAKVDVPSKPEPVKPEVNRQPVRSPSLKAGLRVLTVPPGAEIKLTPRGTTDVRVLGHSPLSMDGLEPGEYRLTVTLDGVLKESMIELERGVPLVRTFQFRSAKPTELPERLAAGEIQTLVKRQIAKIQVCAAKSGGRFIPQIEVIVSPSGRDVRTRDVQPGITNRSECYQNLIRSLTFPASKTGGVAKILFPEQAPPLPTL